MDLSVLLVMPVAENGVFFWCEAAKSQGALCSGVRKQGEGGRIGTKASLEGCEQEPCRVLWHHA